MLNLSQIRRRKGFLFLVSIIVILLVVVGIFLLVTHKGAQTVQQTISPTIVYTKQVNDLASASTFSAVGTVEAVSEAQLQTQAGGEVTSVSVKIGDTVRAGAILATIENSSQSAAVQQAKGALAAAKAGAASSQVSVSSAENGLSSALTSGINTYQSGFISIDSILHNDVDTLFSIVNNVYTGLRIDGKGQAPSIVDKRNALEAQLDVWSVHTNEATKDDIATSLDNAHYYVLDVSQFVDMLYSLANDEAISSVYTAEDKAAYQTLLSADRVKLNTALQGIDSARAAIVSAQKAVQQAQLAGSSEISSASSAQIEIAQGALSAAEANYEKTIVRSPIFGTVNALYIKTGDYVNPSQKAAIVANNSGLEITTSVSQADALKLSLGDQVTVEGSATGTIVAISPAVDPQSGKVTVKIGIQGSSTLINGSTVSITFTQKSENNSALQTFNIPLTALKITASGPIAFKVVQDQTLTAIPVTLGNVNGDFVAVLSGLTGDMQIVTDARGLKAGQTVTLGK